MRYMRHKGVSPIESLTLASMCATDFVCGALCCSLENDGWARPQRFGDLQRRSLSSCLAWHPGVYRQMAQTTAGVCVRFATDAAQVALALRMDPLPDASLTEIRTMRKDGDADGERNTSDLASEYDGISIEVDGRPASASVVELDVVRFSLEDPRVDPGNGIIALPGLGRRHEVSMWLPCLRGCELRELWADGTYVEAMPQSGRLLVLGDEPGQGFGARDCAHTWPVLVARSLGMELVNQSVGGQVFQPSSLPDAYIEHVEQVVVDLGDSYAHERCGVGEVAADVRAYFGKVARLWPNAQVWVLLPVPRDGDTVCAGSCFPEVAGIVRECAAMCEAHVLEKRDLLGPKHAASFVRAGYLDASAHKRLADGLLCKM